MKLLFEHKPTFVWPVERRIPLELEVYGDGTHANYLLWRNEDYEITLNLVFDRLYHTVYSHVLHPLLDGTENRLKDLTEKARFQKMAEIIAGFNR